MGGIGPIDEICDCKDNDCDAETDEGSECPGGATCVDCNCAMECHGIELECAVGRECRCGILPADPTACFCMPVLVRCGTTSCDAAACKVCDTETLTCVDKSCAECETCQMGSGECVPTCAGMDCAPLVCICDECLTPDCYTAGYECPAGQQCDPDPETGRGRCVDDPCYDTVCDAPQFCRDGTCHDPCEVEDVCPTCQVCYDGTCRDDLCCDVTCDPGRTCDPATGTCTDRCAAAACAWPLACDPATGSCEEPTCWDIECAAGYDCVDDTCVARGGPADDQDAGDGDTANAPDQGVQVLATGAGGCSCRVPATGPTDSGTLLLIALALFGIVRRRSGKETKP
jgi:MYXO-CTERM domain-containing protein